MPDFKVSRGATFKYPKLTGRALAFGLILILSGCLNAGKEGAKTSSTTAALSGLGGASLPPSVSVYPITLINGVASNNDPSNLLDLIGSSGEIGTYCPTTASCRCRLDWTVNGSSYQTETPPAYVERDLVRCSYTAAKVAPTFRISVSVVSGGLSSNALTIANPYSNPTTDTSLLTNYRKVARFQCRDIVSVNSDFYNGTLLDPQVWNLGYTFNLITTSLGRDYGLTSAGFECPVQPTTLLGSPYATADGVYDMRIYSVAPLSGDSTIYPSDDSVGEATGSNRHDFFLAASMNSTFRQPVCAPHTVMNGNNSLTKAALDCSVDSSVNPPLVGSDVIGFAAVPDATEACPSGVSLPAGKKWAKLWQFRASLSARAIVNVANPTQVGDLFCTSTDSEFTGTNTTLNGYRYATAVAPTWNIGFQLMASSGGLEFGNCRGASCTQTDGSARYNMRQGYGNTVGATCAGSSRDTFCTSPALEFDALFPSASTTGAPGLRHGGGVLDAGTGAAFSSTSFDGFIQVPSDASFGRGGPYCNPTLPGDRWSLNAPVNPGTDVWLFGNGSTGTCIEADTSSAGVPYNDRTDGYATNPIKNWFDFVGVSCPAPGDCSVLPAAPVTAASRSPATSWGGYGVYQFTTKMVDSSSSSDYIYVVTPTSVTRAQMENPADPTFLQYQPYRIVNGATVYYNLSSGGLNVADPALRLPIYPLCILQDAP